MWEIGNPNKLFMDSSFESLNSIVTSLDSLYSNSSNSVFYTTLYPESYLGNVDCNFTLSLKHKFKTNSPLELGRLEYSINEGIDWFNLLSFNNTNSVTKSCEEHYFESSGNVESHISITGNSLGWVHSNICIDDIGLSDGLLGGLNRIMLKFTFISDSIGRDEGWQIDDICMECLSFVPTVDLISSKNPMVNPNPNNGNFKIENIDNINFIVFFDLLGTNVLEINTKSNVIDTKLPKGIYMVLIHTKENVFSKKIVIE